MLHKNFLGLTTRKKLDYLYTYLIDEDFETLMTKYGPKEIQVLMHDEEVIIIGPTYKDCKIVATNIAMNGIVLVDSYQSKENGKCVISYINEGHVQAICLN